MLKAVGKLNKHENYLNIEIALYIYCAYGLSEVDVMI